MDYNSAVSIILPDSINLMENDFDEEDIIYEQINQNEIVELIMAAFEGHDESSDSEDDESLNTSDSSHTSSDEQLTLNNNDEQDVQEQNEFLHPNPSHQQTFFPTSIISISPPLVTLNNHHAFQNEENTKNHMVHYQNPNRSLSNTPSTSFHYLPNDPLQAQYLYQTSSTSLNENETHLNQLRILCRVKDRKACQLQNLCEEFREKYECDTRALRQQLELSERSKSDGEQRYQLINTQYAELIETNKQLQRTIKDSELTIQQLETVQTQSEKKVSDSESLIESLHRKVNELQQFEAIVRTQQDYETVLAATREKHEQEIISFNEKLQNSQMNLTEKILEADELRVQLETANKNNEKTIFERMETINQLNEQLYECQRKYTDLLTTTSLESIDQTQIQRQLTHITEDKEKLESQCQELQSEIRRLRKGFNENQAEVNNAVFRIKYVPMDDHDSSENSTLNESIIQENFLLKERINEYIFKEKQLQEINDELKQKIQEIQYQSKRCDSSSSSSSSSSTETVITTGVHMEQIRKLTNHIEKLKKDHADFQEQHDYEKQELNSIIEQLREDVNEVDQIKQLYIDACQEKNSIADTLRSKFEYEFKIKLDNLHQILEKEYQEKVLSYNHNQEKLQEDNQNIQKKYNQDLEQQSKEFYQEIERIKVKHEKQINELRNELDRLRANDDAKNRLVYIEKEFEQLKHDYYNLNMKQSELLKTCSRLENENEQFERQKLQIIQRFENEIKQLNEHHKQELLSIHKQTDQNQYHFKEDLQSLQLRLNNYENVVTQYEEYRVKLENNLQKITQQRDTHKIELRLTKEILSKKEEDYHQLKLHLEQCEKHLQTYQEQFRQYECNINDLQEQIKQYDLQTQELNQTRLDIIQETEAKYREKLLSLDAEKCQVEQQLQEANQALDLADCHLQQEVEKIKINLEQEYDRRYERDYKQHQHDLHQLRQQLTIEFNKQRSNSSSSNLSNYSLQDIEDIKKMYRTEMDRLYHENLELSQHQSKLTDTHQKQMQIMKKELDDGYHHVINEFQREQTRLQTRCDHLKQQLNDAQHTIEQLKFNLNHLKTNHHEEISRVQDLYHHEKYSFEHGNRTRQDNLQNRFGNLVKSLEQSNDTLNQERTLHAKQENEYQHTINSLQRKIADMIKQHAKAIDELKRELQQKRVIPRPISVPEFPSNDFSSIDIKSDYMTTVEKLRELFTNEMLALLRLTCKMVFDVHHKVILAPYMDNLDISMKKQIQNELIRSRNSMIKEIRREILEKMTYALRSQRVPDKLIDMHILELDRLLSQMVQDCLNSLPKSSQPASKSSLSSLHITPQQPHSVVSNSSVPKKSIECLYMTPTVNKQPAPLAPHSRSTFDIDRRPKSTSNLLLANRSTISSSSVPSHPHRFQKSTNRNIHRRTHRSEADLIVATERNPQEKTNSDHDHDDTLTLCEEEKEPPPSNVRILAKQFEQKTNSLSDHAQMKPRTPNIPCTTTRVLYKKKPVDEEEELTWPQKSLSTLPSTHSSGIKKFVRNSLKLFIAQPQQQQQQQHKRTGK